MPDVWAAVAELDSTMQERLADVLETRGADPRQRDMRRTFLADIEMPAGADVLEVGCGTGVLTRVLAGLPEVDTVVGVDVAASLLDKARELAAGVPNVAFEEADARSLPFAGERFDVVVFDSTLSHVPEPERALAEAFRVLRPDGLLAAFDGVGLARSHGFVETGDGGYMLTVVDRGADMLRGTIGDELAEALKSEARRRVEAGGFFGHIAYASIVARRPAG